MAPENRNVLFLIGWFQFFGMRRNAGFLLVDLIFFAPIVGALNSLENFDAMNVRRYGKSSSPFQADQNTSIPCDCFFYLIIWFSNFY